MEIKNESITDDSVVKESLKVQHFTDGFNYYKIFWIFFIGSITGFLVESIWCIFRKGYFESRSSIIYAPLAIIYGFGGIIIYVILKDMYNYKLCFILGAVGGTIVEFLCSFLQEKVFGTVSWDYSHLPFNINGRICLVFSICWGLLAILWVKYLQPFLDKLLRKIPNTIGKPLTIVLFVIVLSLGLLSFLTVLRWGERIDGVQATSSLGKWLDYRFPNEFMKIIYPNMKFL